MLTKKQVRKLLIKVFEEEALVIGGMAAMREIDEALLCRLIENLQVIADKSVRKLDTMEFVRGGRNPKVTPHPAINLFLLKLRCMARTNDA